MDLVDDEFAGIREDFAMSAVKDEARKIVEQARDCGPIGEQATGSDSADAQSVHDALAVAQAELAAAAGKTPCTAVPEKNASMPDTASNSDLDLSSRQVEDAVAGIEQGIRDLATLVRSKTHQGSEQVGHAVEGIDPSRKKLANDRQSTEAMVREIARLREEAQIACDDANVARREAKLFRDAARQAKERAETSAAAAELAADKANREAEAARSLTKQSS